MAQIFIQFSLVIAEMTVTRQKWGKTMATDHNQRFQQKKQDAVLLSVRCDKGHVQ